jgi:glycosyltransferase involved in cell wall biosynthesis
MAVRTVDLAQPLHPIGDLARYAAVRLYVMYRGRPLGAVDIWSSGTERLSVMRLRDAIAERFGTALFKEQVTRFGTPPPLVRDPLPPTVVSVVLPTCDRPDDLRRCLASLVAQRTRHTLEIIVVDNRPLIGSATAVAREFPNVKVIAEPRPGLSYARNAGLSAARGAIIVATDDDVTAPDGWVEQLVAPFVRPEVMCVTGNVLPVELETQAQIRFEDYGGLGKGFTPFETNGEWFRTRRLSVPTWLLGATANAAFRASVFGDPRIGLLDEALGAGMPTGCSEDTYVFYKILKTGGTIVYDPSAFVWHRHRTTMGSLRQQIRAYSRGHVAYHLLTLMRDGDRRALLRLAYELPITYVRRVRHWLRGWSSYPPSLILLEILGNLEGPFALWRSMRRVRRFGRSNAVRQTLGPQIVGNPPAERSDVVPVEGSLS